MELQDNIPQKQNISNNAIKKKENNNVEIFRAGFVAIIGRPSVGKSTFINYVCKNPTAITSPYPQTTRSIIKGIVNRNNFQLIFLDTPGFHKSETIFGKHLTKQAQNALQEAQGILYMLDASRAPMQEEYAIAQKLLTTNMPIFACVNKMDIEESKIVHAHLDKLREFLSKKLISCHFISSIDGTNINSLIEDIAGILPPQEAYYPTDYYTDQTPEFRICEQVRAATLEFVKEEIPHALYTELIESSIKQYDKEHKPSHVFLRVQLVVERSSQRGILIGKDGTMIKKIRLNATKRLNMVFDFRTQLELRVIVKKKWRKNSNILTTL